MADFFKSQNASSSDDGNYGDNGHDKPGLTAVECFYNDFASFSESMQERDGCYMRNLVSWHVNKDVHEDVEICASLLLGPWTDSKIKKLFWMVKSGARINWLNSTSGEVSGLFLNDFVLILTLSRWHSKV